jgi:5-methylcytosine-specific restriction endonuclease McrA
VKSCARCGRAGPDVTTKPHRPTHCPPCRHETETQRNKRRPWYRGQWSQTRRNILITQWRCTRCGTYSNLQVDHVKARSLEGGLDVLCATCHANKGKP